MWAGCFALFCACSSSPGATPDPSGTPGEDGGTANDAGETPDAGPPFEPRQPCTTDDDCELAEESCVRFGEDGPTACHIGPLEPMACMPNVPQDCCDDADCGDARCIGEVTSPVECSPSAGFDFRNRCLSDGCTSDADCQSTDVCAPEGFGNTRECIFALCRTDADCTAEPGGACVVLNGGCCISAIGGGASRPTQLACTYPSDGCQLDTDCDEGRWCSTTSTPGRARCSTEC
jgi:hypothetical protein